MEEENDEKKLVTCSVESVRRAVGPQVPARYETLHCRAKTAKQSGKG